jgi:UPF0176 protein
MQFVNIAAYKFVDLDDVAPLRTQLKSKCDALGLKGTILLAPEGINLCLAGPARDIAQFNDALKEDRRFADLAFKQSVSSAQPFRKMLVKAKREIVAFGLPTIRPALHPAPRISPVQLKRWLDEGRDVALLDARNAFEVARGSFDNALDLELTHFRGFADAARALDPALKEKPLVTFCTGGIRCEKAAPLLLRQGYRHVYQLDGGILNYFAQCGSAHFHGTCFVFDERVALDAELATCGARVASNVSQV